jgi:uncharacterized protein YaaN involved in tellurite resistance
MLQKQTTQTTDKPLQLATKENVSNELALVVAPNEQLQVVPHAPAVAVAPTQFDNEIETKARQFVDQLLNPKMNNSQRRDAVDTLGAQTTEKARQYSAMLSQPIKNLKTSAVDGGGPIANSLVELTMQVEELDPIQLSEAGGFSRLVGAIPGVGKPIKRYFMKFESAQTIIERIMNSLDVGRKQLIMDNKILSADQERMREITLQLQKVIAIGQRMDELLSEKLQIGEVDPENTAFVETELLFPLRQKIQDIQQQLLVNQQGFIAVEIIIRNNRELIRGVNRAKDVTLTALQVAVAVALALANQKIVLDKISALNTTTDKLLSTTSQMLATQGVAIQKQASTTMLNMESLQNNFNILSQAVKELSEFRQQALPEMANAILTMGELAKQAEHEIQKIERGNAVRESSMVFDV